MKKLMCLSLCFVLCGCKAMPTAQNVEVKKVNVNVIEVSASSLDEIEEMATKDVEDTKEKLESKRDALSEEILDFDAYTKNVNKVKAYYEDALKQTELLSIRLREYAYKYAELIMKEDTSYKEKYKDLSGIYDYIYDDAREQNEYGFASVKKNGMWGCVNSKGKQVMTPAYQLESNSLIEFINKWHLGEDLNLNYYTDK